MTGEQVNRDRKYAAERSRRQSRRVPTYDSEFVNRELDVEQVVQYRSWREDVEDVTRCWGEALEAGYKLNTKWDDYSSAFAAFLIPGEDGDNVGFILTGRGGTPYRALAECLFKHEFVFRGVWNTHSAGGERRDDPDF